MASSPHLGPHPIREAVLVARCFQVYLPSLGQLHQLQSGPKMAVELRQQCLVLS